MAREFTFTCPLASGLHARPAAQLAERAGLFSSASSLTNLRNGSEANLKSPLAIIAANVRNNDECTVRISGNDEDAAVASLENFIDRDLPRSDDGLPAGPAAEQHGAVPRVIRESGVGVYSGLVVHRGIGVGKIVWTGRASLPDESDAGTSGDPVRERQRTREALARVSSRLQAILAMPGSNAQMGIIKAQLAIAGDLSLATKIEEEIARGRSAVQAVTDAARFFLTIFQNAESAYLRQRALDFEDVIQSLLEELGGGKRNAQEIDLREPSVLVAETLSPGQLLALNRKYLKAVVLENGSTTSHGVILARSLGIPTLVGVKDARRQLSPDREVVADGNRGLVAPMSNPAVRDFYEREAELVGRRRQALAREAKQTAQTLDGRKLEVAANVAREDDLASAFEQGADGIGLFRTEMLLVGSDSIPAEEEQAEPYARAARLAGGRPVIIRTLDIGGDKPVLQMHLPEENNPFLGYRGVRIYPEFRDLIRTQVRAILRVSAFGRVQMMIPMVSSLEEVLWMKDLVAEVKRELREAGVGFEEQLPLGVMIETPAAAFLIDELAAEMDFFSLGTNDLCQYFFAAERGNEKVAALAQERRPAFLRFLRQIVSLIRKAGKPVGMCGDMAADVRNLPLLIGLGLDEISVPASEIPALKQCVRRLNAASCEKLLARAASCRNVREVDELLDAFQTLQPPRPLLTPELVVMGQSSENKQAAIRQIAEQLFVSGRIKDASLIEEALWDREAISSTGLGFGFAIPHCKTDAVTADSVGIFKLDQAISWGSVDDEPVRMIVLLAVRESKAGNRHLQILSRLARKLMDEAFRSRLLGFNAAAELLPYLSQELDLE